MGPTATSLVLDVDRYFCNIAWGVTKGTTTHFHVLPAGDAHGASITPLVCSPPLGASA